jgi:hypothetical protein
MPVATRPRLFLSRLLPLLVVVAGLASSCQSSRPSFAFQPTPHRTIPVKKTTLVAVTPDSIGATVAPVPSVPTGHAISRTGHKARRQAAAARVATVAKAALVPTLGRPDTVRRRTLLHRSQGTAEVGLGTTVLGVLGLVALPIALIGLAISGGGLVWAIVAGAAALAVLVAYIDPFGR